MAMHNDVALYNDPLTTMPYEHMLHCLLLLLSLCRGFIVIKVSNIQFSVIILTWITKHHSEFVISYTRITKVIPPNAIDNPFPHFNFHFLVHFIIW